MASDQLMEPSSPIQRQARPSRAACSAIDAEPERNADLDATSARVAEGASTVTASNPSPPGSPVVGSIR